MFNANMRSKIEDIDTRLQNIVTDMNGLGLIESTGRRTRTTRSWVPTTSLVNEDGTGRMLKAHIISQLFNPVFSSSFPCSSLLHIAWSARHCGPNSSEFVAEERRHSGLKGQTANELFICVHGCTKMLLLALFSSMSYGSSKNRLFLTYENQMNI
ncbi:hypothetical protein CFP56_033704 [Quercus suber]|uniref:Uncharacterized protein n=1 Tax=Quercus suber TaxID=58331 RepID=A0AAW0JEN9_QUESU